MAPRPYNKAAEAGYGLNDSPAMARAGPSSEDTHLHTSDAERESSITPDMSASQVNSASGSNVGGSGSGASTALIDEMRILRERVATLEMETASRRNVDMEAPPTYME
jgi:hypothetical protein